MDKEAENLASYNIRELEMYSVKSLSQLSPNLLEKMQNYYETQLYRVGEAKKMQRISCASRVGLKETANTEIISSKD